MSSPDARWVFDTNAIVSALLFEQSVPGQAFHTAIDCGSILLSDSTVAELVAVLARKKFKRYLTLEEREQFVSMLVQVAMIVEITEAIRACRDPKDDKFLETALAGKASCLVSGDADLLALNPFRGIPILNPAAFLAWLPKSNPDRG
jgi:putative PIN family toxin of toxin-antitoxin system